MENKKIVFALEHSDYLAQEVCEISGEHKFGEIEFSNFQDGEGQMVIQDSSDIRKKDILLIGSLEKDKHFLEMASLVWAFRHQFRAKSVELVIPYLGYSTMERMAKVKGEVARGIPHVQMLYGMSPKRINFFDLHVENFLTCGGVDAIGEHIIGEPLIFKIVQEIKERVGDVTLVSPDVGRGAWVKSLAKKLDIPFEILNKVRSKTEKDKTSTEGGNKSLIKDRTAIIFDDMMRTGGTAIGAADRLVEMGAKSVEMVVSHLVLPKGAEERITDSSIDIIHGTNSTARSQKLDNPNFKVHSIAQLIVDYVKR